MEVVYLTSLNLGNALVNKIADVCDNTRLAYLKEYNSGGIERLKEVNFYQPSSELKEYSGTIESYFRENPPTSILQAAAKIEELTGIKRGETQVRKFLKSLKFKYAKVGSVPAKALTEEKKTNKENFWKKTWNPD
jgi:transposase